MRYQLKHTREMEKSLGDGNHPGFVETFLRQNFPNAEELRMEVWVLKVGTSDYEEDEE